MRHAIAVLASLCAEQFGLFTYQVIGNTVEITGYHCGETGHVEIPARINRIPVTRIGDDSADVPPSDSA